VRMQAVRKGSARFAAAIAAAVCAVAVSLVVSAVPAFAVEYSNGNTAFSWAKQMTGLGDSSKSSFTSTTETAPALDNISALAKKGSGLVAFGTITSATDSTLAPASVLAAQSTTEDSDAGVIVYDASHAEVARYTVGGSQADSFVDGLVDANGNIVAVGSTQSADGDFSARASEKHQDGMLCRIDANGNKQVVLLGGADKGCFTSVTEVDDGYIVVGFVQDAGDLADTLGKSATDRDAIIAKYSKDDLSLVWIKAFGGSSKTGYDDFHDVMATDDGGIIVVGEVASTDDSYDTATKYGNAFPVSADGSRDSIVVKFALKDVNSTVGGADPDLAIEWSVCEGMNGAKNDCLISVAYANGLNSDEGYVVSGRTKSVTDTHNDTKDKSYIAKISAAGQLTASNVLGDGSESAAEEVTACNGGFLVAGFYKAAAGDFAGCSEFQAGDRDVYVVYLDNSLNVQKISSFGGTGKDSALALLATDNGYVVGGNYTSPNGEFLGLPLAGGADGFLMGIESTSVQPSVTGTYTMGVGLYKASDPTSLSMAAPSLYEDAYIEEAGDSLSVTLYFTNAVINGYSFVSRSLTTATYDRAGDGTMVAMSSTSYDESTQVRSYTMTLKESDLTREGGIKLHVNGMMTDEGQDLALKFDPSTREEGASAPVFPEITVEVDNFATGSVLSMAGTSSDVPADMAVNEDGDILVAGTTQSNDHDFATRGTSTQSGFVESFTYDDQKQELVKTALVAMLENAKSVSVADIVVAEDGGYYVTGRYSESTSDLTGMFADAKTSLISSADGQANAFVAKFDSSNKVVWVNGPVSSATTDGKAVAPTSDGGCIVVMQVVGAGFTGDYADEASGPVFTVVQRYAADGSKGWSKVLAKQLVAGYDIAQLSDGSFAVTGMEHASATGEGCPFAGCEYYGGQYDIFVMDFADVSSTEYAVKWASTYGGTSDGSDQESPSRIVATEDGGFILVGNTASTGGTWGDSSLGNSNAFVLKCNAAGSVAWSNILQSTGWGSANGAAETDDYYVVVGETEGNDYVFKGLNKGDADAFVAWYSKDTGECVNVKTLGGSNTDSATAVAYANGTTYILMDSNSNDGDMANKNVGGKDGYLISVASNADTTALQAAIASAQTASADVVVSSQAGADVEPTAKWVSAEAQQALDDAVAAGKALIGVPGVSQSEVDAATQSITEAVAAYAPAAGTKAQEEPAQETNSMYRMYNPNSGEHFYTAVASERDHLKQVGWTYEGVAWEAPVKSEHPVYRLYNPNGGDHHYTMSEEERDGLIVLGWRYEGIGWYSDDDESVPLYRLYNPNADTGSHHYTMSAEERDGLTKLGWQFEGIGWYGVN